MIFTYIPHTCWQWTFILKIRDLSADVKQIFSNVCTFVHTALSPSVRKGHIGPLLLYKHKPAIWYFLFSSKLSFVDHFSHNLPQFLYFMRRLDDRLLDRYAKSVKDKSLTFTIFEPQFTHELTIPVPSLIGSNDDILCWTTSVRTLVHTHCYL